MEEISDLAFGQELAGSCTVHAADNHGAGRRSRENKPELFGDIDYVELAKKGRESKPEVGTDDSQRNKSSKNFLRCGEQVELV